ncbi:helix-turn-helix transcriptional regulator [Natronobacterium gregoryi]|uniref:Transcriptional regulator n=2 Tax=Natronobacterium gregoryi TaxID=44930 RepID=L0AC40_NATGS|nr:helix-turn-helix transcriptional regulator [Natronobacterium gregoryi]AFZ71436.1 putative transcriptional regulator [Natronobacterium gregoryi SP2]ELY66738.1 transcriptional regulator PadR family protein [Natronobacterium gregoryi SP2]PLK19970.1 PadR family transcriptional regulator [Natronobacterium gregoryi SP2]SFJ35831.1 Transcriptional regulator PadR-like family protein [Natronobacterium gregoryi]
MGDYGLYSCDTPGCDNLKEVVTPDGYVCHDCSDELAEGYEAEPELIADGGTAWGDLTGFQRDVLEAIAQLERTDDDSYGLAIKERLEPQYGEVLHGRLYQNLDALVDDDLLERDDIDGRTNSYTLTTAAAAMLEESIYRRADACGLQVAATDGGFDE